MCGVVCAALGCLGRLLEQQEHGTDGGRAARVPQDAGQRKTTQTIHLGKQVKTGGKNQKYYFILTFPSDTFFLICICVIYFLFSSQQLKCLLGSNLSSVIDQYSGRGKGGDNGSEWCSMYQRCFGLPLSQLAADLSTTVIRASGLRACAQSLSL